MSYQAPFKAGDWTVEPELDRISQGDIQISLRPAVMDVLVYLALRSNQVCSANELIDGVWSGKIISNAPVYNCLGELRHALASTSQLRVTARSSSFRFRGSEEDVRSIGKKLGVDYVLEGGVRKEAERVMVTSQLIDTSSGFHVWSGEYDHEVGNIFDIQHAIGSDVSRKLGDGGGDSNYIQTLPRGPGFLYGTKGGWKNNLWNVVYVDLSNLELCEGENCDGKVVADGRDDYLCGRLTNPGGSNFPVFVAPKEDEPDGWPYGRLSAYYFGLHESNDELCAWDSTSENICKVIVVLRGYFLNESNQSGKSGRLIGLEAWGHVTPAGNPLDDPIEINPFTVSRDIWIEELTVYFRGICTNRTVANCYYDNREYVDGEWTGDFLKGIVFKTCVDPNDCEYVVPSQ